MNIKISVIIVHSTLRFIGFDSGIRLLIQKFSYLYCCYLHRW